jgi:tripartite-type tricarboxylate transporter receptor subunit TctC
LKKSLPYDPAGFAPVALAATSAMALVVGPQVDAKSLPELVALSKKQPGTLFYASPGAGSIQHMTMELVKLETGLDATHVPYKGSAGAAQDLVGGRVQAMIAALQTMAPFVASNRLRMVAVLSDARSPAFPDVPTMKELGHPALVVDTWYGVMAPKGTPREAITALNAAINEGLKQPAMREALARQGLEPVVDRPERLGSLVAEELARWKRVAASSKIEAE